jgi:hypothetical protein
MTDMRRNEAHNPMMASFEIVAEDLVNDVYVVKDEQDDMSSVPAEAR